MCVSRVHIVSEGRRLRLTSSVSTLSVFEDLSSLPPREMPCLFPHTGGRSQFPLVSHQFRPQKIPRKIAKRTRADSVRPEDGDDVGQENGIPG